MWKYMTYDISMYTNRPDFADKEQTFYYGDSDDSISMDDEYWVIEQFTGFKDSQGDDIYEGDLVDFAILGRAHGPEGETTRAAEVWWDSETGCWAFGRWTHPDRDESSDHGYTIAGDRIDPQSFKIVGSIHQHA
jgi:hypothetical protein